MKVRQNGRIVSLAVIIAVGVNSDGRREILGLDIGPLEAKTFWTAFPRKLARRGLRGVKLVVSDTHESIKATVRKSPSASTRSCCSRPTAIFVRWLKQYRAAASRLRGLDDCQRFSDDR
jgi:putative transposase